jgi:transposase
MTKQFTPDLKLKAVNYYHKIKNYVKVCEVFECSERSLKRWVERYDKSKNVNRKPRKLGSYKLEKQHIQFIKETLRKHSDIQEIIEVRTDINPAESGPALTKTQTKLKDLWTSKLDVAFYVRNKNGLYPELNLNELRRRNCLTGECPICMETRMLYLRHSCEHRFCSHCYTNCENNGYFICSVCRRA